MNDDIQTSTVLNRVEGELCKLRREQRQRTISTVACLVAWMALSFFRSSHDSDFSRTFMLVLVFTGIADSFSIRRSIRMMESIAAMFPKGISRSEQNAD
ncbi:MAG: hypothetical protein H7062_02620 [Candidatus Saccharimonas sp.]|nr:hypothetical protein [Planctomycetaceae bacterium]